MTNQNIVQSGEIDLTAPQGYLGVAENVKVPAGIVPPGGIVGHFGHTHNEPTQRLMAHNGKFGFFRFIRHFPCANAYGLEQKWKAYLRVKGRLIPVLRADGNVDYESFWVHNLQEWMQFEEEFQKMCDRLVDFICRTEEKRLELKIKEAEIAISANEARKAEADASARRAEAEAGQETKRIQQIEETKRLELRLKYGHTTQLQHGADQSTTEINLASQQHNAGADRPQPGSSVEGPLSTDTKIYVQRRQKAVLQHHFHTGQFIKRFDTVKDVQKAYNCCSKTLSQKIKNQGEFLGSRWTYDMEILNV